MLSLILLFELISFAKLLYLELIYDKQILKIQMTIDKSTG